MAEPEFDPDAGMEAVRNAREAISREFGDDPARLVAHYIELQKRHRDRLISAPRGSAPAGDRSATPPAVPSKP